MKRKTDHSDRDRSRNRTQILRVRCSVEEKAKIRAKAQQTGKKLSEFCREALLVGEVIAVPTWSGNEQEAVRVLQRVAHFFTHISSLIKKKDPAWLPVTKNLAFISLEAFKRFYHPRHRIPDEVYNLLNIERDDCQV